MGEYLGGRLAGEDMVRFLLLGKSLWGSVWGDRGSWFIFSFLRRMSHLASLYHGLMVGSCGWCSTLISFLFSVRYLFSSSLGLHLGHGYSGKESALLGSLVVWRLCLSAASLFGLVGRASVLLFGGRCCPWLVLCLSGGCVGLPGWLGTGRPCFLALSAFRPPGPSSGGGCGVVCKDTV